MRLALIALLFGVPKAKSGQRINVIPKCKHIKHCHSYKNYKNRNNAGFSASRLLILISSGVVGLSWVLPGQL